MSLGLAMSGNVSLPDLRPGQLALSVRTLLAELHEGLFHSQLLLPKGTCTPETDMSSPGGSTQGTWTQARAIQLRLIIHGHGRCKNLQPNIKLTKKKKRIKQNSAMNIDSVILLKLLLDGPVFYVM